MRRRLDLAVSLVATPPVLFLDEPTTGLDPRSRVELWEVLRDLVSDGTTLLLTTQYLEEADQLADDIVVIDQGTRDRAGHAAAAQGRLRHAPPWWSPSSRADDLAEAAELLRPRRSRRSTSTSRAARSPPPAEGLADVTRVATLFDGSGIDLDDLGLQRPSLDDVFLHLTGHRAEESATTEEEVPA